MSACVGQPISWLLLERYQLGELDGDESARISAHIETCDVCSKCLDEVQEPLSLPALPEQIGSVEARGRLRRPAAVGAVLAAAALAAVALLALPPAPARWPGPSERVKGGELAVSLIRERDGDVSLDPSRFAPGDRFKLRATCPPGDAYWDVVVYQSDRAYFPLAGGHIACGNQVVLPGSFALDGPHEAYVCLMLAESAVARERLSRGPQELPQRAVCERVVRY